MEATVIDVGTDCYDDDGDKYCERPPCVNTSRTLIDCDDTLADVNPDGKEKPNGLATIATAWWTNQWCDDDGDDTGNYRCGEYVPNRIDCDMAITMCSRRPVKCVGTCG